MLCFRGWVDVFRELLKTESRGIFVSLAPPGGFELQLPRHNKAIRHQFQGQTGSCVWTNTVQRPCTSFCVCMCVHQQGSTRGLRSASGVRKIWGSSPLQCVCVCVCVCLCVCVCPVIFVIQPSRTCCILCVVICVCLCMCVCETERERVGGVWLVAGEVLLERRKEVSDDGDTPGTPQQPLPGETTHVGHVGVVDRETKHPGNTRDSSFC